MGSDITFTTILGALQISDTKYDQTYSLFHESSQLMIFNITIKPEFKIESTNFFDEHDHA